MSQAFEEAAAVLKDQLGLATDQPDCPARERTAVLLADILIKQAGFRRSLGQTGRAIDLCEESLTLLHDVGQDARRDSLQINAKLELGFLALLSGDSARGTRLRQEAFALAEEAGESALSDLCLDLRRQGQHAEAERLLQRVIAIAEENEDQLRRTSCLDSLSAVLWAKGEYQRARTLAQENLQIRQELGDRSDISYCFLRLSEICTALGDYDLASEYCQRALAIADELGDPLMKVECLMVGPAMLASALGQHEEAKDLFLQALSLGREVGYSERFWSGALAELGYSSLALGEIAEAEDYLRRALGGAMETGFQHVAMNALGGCASLFATEGEPERATELLGLVLHHPSTCQITKDRTRELLSELASELSSEAFAEAIERGQSRELEEVTAEILMKANASGPVIAASA
jgi:tetratricopeptide (TPR) repeat protein